MTPWVHLIPLGMGSLCWAALHLFNKKVRWFRLGEVIFWDAVILVLIFLIWLRWF